MNNTLMAGKLLKEQHSSPIDYNKGYVEIEQEMVSLESLNTEISKKEQAYGLLEGVLSVQEEISKEERTISTDTVKMCNIAIESISNTLDLPELITNVPSVEDYSVYPDKALTVSSEGIKDTLIKAWDHILGFIKTLVLRVKTVIMKIVKYIAVSKKRLDGIIDKAKKADFDLSGKKIINDKLTGAYMLVYAFSSSRTLNAEHVFSSINLSVVANYKNENVLKLINAHNEKQKAIVTEQLKDFKTIFEKVVNFQKLKDESLTNKVISNKEIKHKGTPITIYGNTAKILTTRRNGEKTADSWGFTGITEKSIKGDIVFMGTDSKKLLITMEYAKKVSDNMDKLATYSIKELPNMLKLVEKAHKEVKTAGGGEMLIYSNIGKIMQNYTTTASSTMSSMLFGNMKATRAAMAWSEMMFKEANVE